MLGWLLLIALGVIGGVLVFGFGIFRPGVAGARPYAVRAWISRCALGNRPHDRNRQGLSRSTASSPQFQVGAGRNARTRPAPDASPTTSARSENPRTAGNLHRPPAKRASLDHVLLRSARAWARTTLAHIIAATNGRQPALDLRPGAGTRRRPAAILTNLEPHDVLFIDESTASPGGRETLSRRSRTSRSTS